MKVRRIEFFLKRISCENFNFGDIDEIKISMFEKSQKIIVEVVSGDLKIVDSTIRIDTNYILKLIGKVDFDNEEEGKNFEFFKCFWKLSVNDLIYFGTFHCPRYVSEVKKIIKFDVIFDLMQKKVANYSKNQINTVPFLND